MLKRRRAQHGSVGKFQIRKCCLSKPQRSLLFAVKALRYMVQRPPSLALFRAKYPSPGHSVKWCRTRASKSRCDSRYCGFLPSVASPPTLCPLPLILKPPVLVSHFSVPLLTLLHISNPPITQACPKLPCSFVASLFQHLQDLESLATNNNRRMCWAMEREERGDANV